MGSLAQPCRVAEKAPKVLNLSPGDQTLAKATLRWEQVPSCDPERVLLMLHASPTEPGQRETLGKIANGLYATSAHPFCEHLLFSSSPALILPLLLNS